MAITVIIQLIHEVPLDWTLAEMVDASTIVPPFRAANRRRHSPKHLLQGVFLSLHLVKFFTPVSGRWNPECERAYAWSDDFSFLVIQLESTCGEIKSHSFSDSQVKSKKKHVF